MRYKTQAARMFGDEDALSGHTGGSRMVSSSLLPLAYAHNTQRTRHGCGCSPILALAWQQCMHAIAAHACNSRHASTRQEVRSSRTWHQPGKASSASSRLSCLQRQRVLAGFLACSGNAPSWLCPRCRPLGSIVQSERVSSRHLGSTVDAK